MRFEAEPGSEAHEILARQRMAREKLIASIPEKGSNQTFTGVKNGFEGTFTINKKDFYKQTD